MAFGLALMDAIEVAAPPVHPGEPGIHGCHHAQLVAPGSTAEHSRHAMVIQPGYFDRSPCGTGTSARMAQLYARGLLGLDVDFTNTSLLDRPFIGRLVESTTVAGLNAVVPTITGSAWITGTSQYVLDPTDPFPTGFLLG
jgi:proline racemase